MSEAKKVTTDRTSKIKIANPLLVGLQFGLGFIAANVLVGLLVKAVLTLVVLFL